MTKNVLFDTELSADWIKGGLLDLGGGMRSTSFILF